jgi:asparagine synthase (glutamine-hydrolysing)
MCGILCRTYPTGIDTATTFDDALAALAHRGPDSTAVVAYQPTYPGSARRSTDARSLMPGTDAGTPTVLLGHRRLSILDLSSAGLQPMSGSDGRFWLILNGEIYNYLEIRAQLEEDGIRFASSGDTEVALAALAKWGVDALSRFRGMFALVLLDTHINSLLIARDPLGIKPLYYRDTVGGGIAIGSEPQALLFGDRTRIDPVAAFRFLAYGATDVDERTMFAEIKQLPGGCYATVDLGQSPTVDISRYWNPVASPGGNESPDVSLRAELARTIALHMRSDVPVGTCLSGGLDSTAIAILASRSLSSDDPRFHGVTFRANDSAQSDAAYATRVAADFGLTLSTVSLTAAETVALIPEVTRVQGEPFGGPSVIAQYAVFKRASDVGLKVMLDGQGADEIFAGYPTMASAFVVGELLRLDFASAARAVRSPHFPVRSQQIRILLAVLGRAVPSAWRGIVRSLIGKPLLTKWTSSEWFKERNVKMATRPIGTGRDALHEELRSLATQWSLPGLLRYEDRNSMSHSIEARVPFCTREMLELALRFSPTALFDRNGNTKAVLRRAVEGVVPQYVIERSKSGFDTDEQSIFTQLFASQYFSDLLSASTGCRLFDVDEIRRASETAVASQENRRAIFRAISILEWANTFNVDLT